jgi:hypothetical protein
MHWLPQFASWVVCWAPLDLITYRPDRTRLVFPEGSFDAQVGAHGCLVYMHMLYKPCPVGTPVFADGPHCLCP